MQNSTDTFNSVCLFVSSSDNTKDVFFQVSKCFEKHWPDCPFPKFVGLNSPSENLPSGFEAVYADKNLWQGELLAQLKQLPGKYRYVLLILDDYFILSPVDTNRVLSLIKRAVEGNIRYMRLVPQSRAMLPYLGRKLSLLFNPTAFEEIGSDTPYYASLQVVLWEREHLCNMLNIARDIWAFEHLNVPGIKHHAMIGKPPIQYRHMVEKGKWQPYAATIFEKAGLSFDPPTRQTHSTGHRYALWINRIKFAVMGYSVFKLKRRYGNKDAPSGGMP